MTIYPFPSSIHFLFLLLISITIVIGNSTTSKVDKSLLRRGREAISLPGSHWKNGKEFNVFIEELESLANEGGNGSEGSGVNISSSIEANAILMRLHWEGKLPHLNPDWSMVSRKYWPLCKSHPDCRFIAAVMMDNNFLEINNDSIPTSDPSIREAQTIALLKMASYSNHSGAQEALAFRLSSSKRGLSLDYKAARKYLFKVAKRVLSELVQLSQSTNSGPFGHLMRGNMTPLHQSQKLFVEPLGSIGINLASSTSSLDDIISSNSEENISKRSGNPDSELKALMLLSGDRLPHAPSLGDLVQFFRWSSFNALRYSLCLFTFITKKFQIPEIEDSFTADQLVSLGQFYQFGESSKDRKSLSSSSPSSSSSSLIFPFSFSSLNPFRKISPHGSRSPITSNNEDEYSHSIKMAEKMYYKATLLGSPTAHGLLGLSLLRTSKDPPYSQALYHLKIASEYKSSYGNLGLGLCYAHGLIDTSSGGDSKVLLEKDEEIALKLLKQAADAGLAQGHFEYSKLLQRMKIPNQDAIVNGFVMSLKGGMLVGAWELGNLFIANDVLHHQGGENSKLLSTYERNSLTSLKLLQLIVDRCPTTLRKMSLASKAVRDNANKGKDSIAHLWSALAIYLEASTRGWPIAFSNSAWIMQQLKEKGGFENLDDRIIKMWLGAATRSIGIPRDEDYEKNEERSDVGALLRLGDIFNMKKEYRLSAALYYRALRLNGSPEAAFNLSLLYDDIDGSIGKNDDDISSSIPKSAMMAEQLLRISWSQSLQKDIAHLAWLPIFILRLLKRPFIRKIYQMVKSFGIFNDDFSPFLCSLQVIIGGIAIFQWIKK